MSYFSGSNAIIFGREPDVEIGTFFWTRTFPSEWPVMTGEAGAVLPMAIAI